MKSFRKNCVDTPARVAFVNITPQVEACIRESGVKEGLVLVNAMHITASVFVNDDESGCITIIPFGWKSSRRMSRSSNNRHNDTAKTTRCSYETAGDGREVVVAITDASSTSDRGEQIFYARFDGRRKKRVLVKIIGE